MSDAWADALDAWAQEERIRARCGSCLVARGAGRKAVVRGLCSVARGVPRTTEHESRLWDDPRVEEADRANERLAELELLDILIDTSEKFRQALAELRERWRISE